MSFEIKTLDALIRLFTKIQGSAGRTIHNLNFMKYQYLFDERDDDIYVATYLKSGTTWMQMILYQLTTNGDMNFNHIYEVSPWLRNLSEIEGKIPELPSPRIIKTHEYYSQINRGRKGRFIYVVRDGRDVAVSLFHHHKSYNNSEITFDQSFKDAFSEQHEANWFEFNKHWLENKRELPILYVRYEDLKNNLQGELQRIAQFINIDLKPEDMPRILERTSFQFMKTHETKFGEQPPQQKHEPVYNQFIRSGKTGKANN